MEHDEAESEQPGKRNPLGLSYAEVCEMLDDARRAQARWLLLKLWREAAPLSEAEDAAHQAPPAPAPDD